jgi:hypothetical protein
MRKISLFYALILLALPTAATGDIVVLKNGSRFEGEVTERKDGFHVDIGYGKVVIPRETVEKVIKCDTPRQKFEKKLAATDQTDLKQLKKLREWCTSNSMEEEAKQIALKIARLALEKQSAGLDSSSAKTVFDFALWCKRNGYEKSVIESYLWKVLSIDPDHETAREMLGYSKFRGQWLTKNVIADIRRTEYEKEMREKGMVKYKDQWLTPKASAYLKQLEDLNRQREVLERDKRQVEDDERELAHERNKILSERNSLYAEQNRLRRLENTLERTALRQSALVEQLAYDRVYTARLKAELRDLKEELKREKEELDEKRDDLEKEKLRLQQLRFRLDCEWKRLRQAQREKKVCRPEAERPEKAEKAHKGSEEHTPGRQPYSNRRQQVSRRERIRR